MPNGERKMKTGVTRSLLFTPEQDERLNRLCETSGLNRNALVRLIAEKATPRDIRELQDRR